MQPPITAEPKTFAECIDWCVDRGEIPLSLVRSLAFSKLFEGIGERIKAPVYELFHYSRNTQLGVSNDRSGARV